MSSNIPRGWSTVWKMLDDAFSNVPTPCQNLEQEVRDHDYLAEMRFHTWDMSDDEYHFTLPWMLKDLVTHHPTDPVDNLGGDEVLWSLQPWGSEPAILLEKLRTLDLFDAQQGLAIIAWLEKARGLPGFSLSEEEIDSACTFWRDYIGSHPIGGSGQR